MDLKSECYDILNEKPQKTRARTDIIRCERARKRAFIEAERNESPLDVDKLRWLQILEILIKGNLAGQYYLQRAVV